MLKYKEVEFWKEAGYIDNNLTIEEQIKLSDNLNFGKIQIQCRKILNCGNDNINFYNNIEPLLYSIIKTYTNRNIDNIDVVVHNFIDYCERYYVLKYKLDSKEECDLIIKDFIEEYDKN